MGFMVCTLCVCPSAHFLAARFLFSHSGGKGHIGSKFFAHFIAPLLQSGLKWWRRRCSWESMTWQQKLWIMIVGNEGERTVCAAGCSRARAERDSGKSTALSGCCFLLVLVLVQKSSRSARVGFSQVFSGFGEPTTERLRHRRWR